MGYFEDEMEKIIRELESALINDKWEKCPYTTDGKDQLAAAIEASGHFVPGSVVVHGDHFEGRLKGRIHTITFESQIALGDDEPSPQD